MSRTSLTRFSRVLLFTLALASAASAQPTEKHLRTAVQADYTGFDPVQISDTYSYMIVDAIFDTPLTYDYLARPLKMVPNVAEALPEISEGGRVYTLRIRPGIFFADDPAFNGQRRELVANDYVYSVKRIFDPKNRSPQQYLLAGKIVGLDDLGKAAQKSGRFDYDREVAGLKALDRYTLQITLTEPDYVFIYQLASRNTFTAQAREVVEKYGGDIMEHPVGTGPFRLASWRRGSRVVLERNPGYREDIFQGEAMPGDALSEKVAAALRGKRLPRLDRITVDVLEEPQPRWLAFLNAEHDLLERVPAEFSTWAWPGNVVAPNLAKRGISIDQMEATDVTYMYFQMEDPVVGGYSPDKVALRRAMVMAYDLEKEIKVYRKNQARQAYSPVSPGVNGYDPAFRSPMAEHSPARAKALLDMYGYVDCDGDGFREAPGCKPLSLNYYTMTSRDFKELAEILDSSMKAIGLRVTFNFGTWPDLLKRSREGKLQMFGLAWQVSSPDAYYFFTTLYGKNAGASSNHSRFREPTFDRLFEKARQLPPGAEREATYREMKRIFLAYAPWRLGTHRLITTIMHPWVSGWKNNPAIEEWKYIDIDVAQREAVLSK
jgi:ABC-type transport system substrate-binding protein